MKEGVFMYKSGSDFLRETQERIYTTAIQYASCDKNDSCYRKAELQEGMSNSKDIYDSGVTASFVLQKNALDLVKGDPSLMTVALTPNHLLVVRSAEKDQTAFRNYEQDVRNKANRTLIAKTDTPNANPGSVINLYMCDSKGKYTGNKFTVQVEMEAKTVTKLQEVDKFRRKSLTKHSPEIDRDFGIILNQNSKQSKSPTPSYILDRYPTGVVKQSVTPYGDVRNHNENEQIISSPPTFKASSKVFSFMQDGKSREGSDGMIF